MKKKKIIVIIMLFCACLTLNGAGWFGTTSVVIDTENNYVYQLYEADEILSEFATDSKAAREKYQGVPLLLSCKVVSVGDGGKNIVVTGMNDTRLTIAATCEKALRPSAMQYAVGDHVSLYGYIIVNIFNNDIYFKVDKFANVPISATSKEMYYLRDGTSFDKQKAIKVTLNNGGVEYYVPTAWTGKKIQHKVKEENLGTMEGYQYVLNKLGTPDPIPESVFVCYFDNKTQLGYAGDAGETKLIEKAIVENILGSVGLFPSKKVKTYYGAEYNYYDGVYKSALEAGDGYRTEFVFQADGEEGIVVILYVYREAKHIKDLLFLTRLLEVK